ncbi:MULTISPECIES: amino acid ABC transporter permease [unclassified Mesorhizobium]|uniref:amino acid ABC transporter permease n=1 Tax=unclassified Mesorhizobium TaxID=325217 RepID=UPI0006FBB5F8|nr:MULTISPECIES: amino acid ABC transporter permease [unclassified Mesorhizobium]KQZ13531.1 amino acid ABC transporter permease [Mesorhizobium sp. Root1471]KQZ36043.1 amino acid ABC transporter permease [Mesorhizobium sp. Root554]MDR7032457.1 general L-amino acid transport system permease protein [Mesorhizobium sp. BE184]
MQEHDMSWVRTEMTLAQTAPRSQVGPGAWIRRSLFSTPTDSVMTILAALVVAWALPQILNWLFFSAIWSGADRTACLTTEQGGQLPAGWSGACWPFVTSRFGQFMFGRYPLEERWRPILTGIIFVALIVPLMIPRAPFKRLNAILFFVVFPFIAFFLLVGGAFGLRFVETPLWGGLLVTLVISYVGIVTSLPIGILLALGRRSKMPAVKLLSVVFIETVRGVPLVVVLFMASFMLPLFVPPGVTFDKLLRALIGVALFSSAYMAEVIRGGLQAIPKGQYEGADSLGLGYWQKMGLIVMPQALTLVIPGIVNSFISLFKDTTLVLIISMFDLLGVVKQNISGDPTWATPQTAKTGYVFAAAVFWIFCFGMSRYSQYMERRLDTGHKR